MTTSQLTEKEQRMFDTARDSGSTVYLGEGLRILGVRRSARKSWGQISEPLAIGVATRVTDRLGAVQWVAGGDISRSVCERLAEHVFNTRGMKRDSGVSWTLIAGPVLGYRLLMRPAPWFLRIFGVKYDFAVERDVGAGASVWRDAEAAYGSAAWGRIAWLLKQELYQHTVNAENAAACERVRTTVVPSQA